MGVAVCRLLAGCWGASVQILYDDGETERLDMQKEIWQYALPGEKNAVRFKAEGAGGNADEEDEEEEEEESEEENEEEQEEEEAEEGDAEEEGEGDAMEVEEAKGRQDAAGKGTSGKVRLPQAPLGRCWRALLRRC